MDTQYRLAAAQVGPVHHDLTIKTAGPHQSGIEHIHPIRRGDKDDSRIGVEAVHLHQHRVQGLFTFVMTAAQARASLTADRVDLIDKNNAGRVFLALLEKIAYPGRAHAHEHLNKVRTGNGKEWNASLTRDRFGQKGFARSWRTQKDHTLGDL